MSDTKLLCNRHVGETAYLIGKGPSLQYLKANHFGEGVVIAINQAIAAIEKLGLPNALYSFQKDGCKHRYNPNHECGYPMIYPSAETVLILTEHFSRYCLPNHIKRLLINCGDFNFTPPEMSLRISLAMAKLMGCSRFVFVCCDSLVTNDLRTYDPYAKTLVLQEDHNNYPHLKKRLFGDLQNLKCDWIIPDGK